MGSWRQFRGADFILETIGDEYNRMDPFLCQATYCHEMGMTPHLMKEQAGLINPRSIENQGYKKVRTL